MMRLSKQRFELAADFIKTTARGLERALFEHEFEGGGEEAVLAELKRYQNEDGGFGRGMEPDFRCVESSSLATSIALRHLVSVKAEASEGIVREAVGHLLVTFEQEHMGWEQVPRAVETAPRAPWWNYKETRTDWGNPNAEIVGYFLKYRQLVPSFLLDRLVQHAVEHWKAVEEYEFHELLCYLRMADHVPAEQADALRDGLQRAIRACVVTDPGQWDSYGLQPLQVAESPDSPSYPLVAEHIPANLDWLIRRQAEDGSWEPTWSWFGQYEEEWQQAKAEWQGSLTLDALRVLRAYDRIEW